MINILNDIPNSLIFGDSFNKIEWLRVSKLVGANTV